MQRQLALSIRIITGSFGADGNAYLMHDKSIIAGIAKAEYKSEQV
ncbi:hypothetical protein [Azomonas macrocytogenes]|uniref:Uncharacterized protein n=1 Tax=Azomonas macrocytogenes TaxID=69962 RepID=A0A839T5N9_AZOMA|nr:hypothetical protein [Azomonas macrocytogenes]MBB3104837.1 hypothetical protein [Azomonas macrocytogenes]